MRASGLRLHRILAIAVVVAGCGTPSSSTVTYQCQPACPTGTTCTADGCVPDGLVLDLAAAANDLGGGGCDPACGGGSPYCKAGICVPCLEDGHCPAGTRCTTFGATTACVPGCADDARCNGEGGGGLRCCGGQCVDPASDPANCGDCGQACVASHATATCAGGVCGAGACATGYGDCNHDGKDGCEANLLLDPGSCGSCGRKCVIANAIAGCSGTCYLAACTFGYADCDGTENNGCETTVLADARNCGSCGAVCAAVAHGKNGCENGACRILSCDNGFADCNGLLVDGCEANTTVDAVNCGKCGNACGQNLVCINGGCTCKNCNFPNARSACVNLQCTIDQCLPGWSDCDGVAGNGCEAPTGSDAKNCGGCNVQCGVNAPYCQGGVCSQVGTSCKQILQDNPKAFDGVYVVDVDGNGPIQPLPVWCDMTTDGGGWLVCYNHEIVDIEEMNQSTVDHMGKVYGVPGDNSEFGTDCRGQGHALQPATVRFTANNGNHWVQITNAPDAVHEFFFAGNKSAGVSVTVSTWSSGQKTFNRLLCVHDCPNFGYNTNNINQLASGTNSGNCFEHNSKNSDSNHHWAIFGNCDGTYVEGPNQGAGGARPDAPRDGWARVMLR